MYKLANVAGCYNDVYLLAWFEVFLPCRGETLNRVALNCGLLKGNFMILQIIKIYFTSHNTHPVKGIV